jgi:proline iminopeptidase
MPENDFFPEIEPFNDGMLRVSAIHTLYYEEVGRTDGKPVVYLHGGPGGRLSPKYRQFFDPEFYRVVLFNQRGAGKSTPKGELEENTTWELVEDIEKLREHLHIDRWMVCGGSWGSTLALAYATKYPLRVIGLILSGVSLGTDSENQWFYQGGAANLFPDAWEKFLAPIPEIERGDMLKAYHKRLMGNDEKARLEAAKAWSIWEMSTLALLPDEAAIKTYEEDAIQALTFATIECHYFVNHCFFKPDTYLLEKAREIAHIPCRIVQGRYDVICPASAAWNLKKAMPSTELRIIQDVGHSPFEKTTVSELIQATEDFKSLFVE